MPTFDYEGVDSEGHTVQGTIEAESSGDAIQKLRQTNLFITRVAEPGSGRGCASSLAAVVLLALAAGVWALLG